MVTSEKRQTAPSLKWFKAKFKLVMRKAAEEDCFAHNGQVFKFLFIFCLNASFLRKTKATRPYDYVYKYSTKPDQCTKGNKKS